MLCLVTKPPWLLICRIQHGKHQSFASLALWRVQWERNVHYPDGWKIMCGNSSIEFHQHCFNGVFRSVIFLFSVMISMRQIRLSTTNKGERQEMIQTRTIDFIKARIGVEENCTVARGFKTMPWTRASALINICKPILVAILLRNTENVR